jgi:hypothetical protein
VEDLLDEKGARVPYRAVGLERRERSDQSARPRGIEVRAGRGIGRPHLKATKEKTPAPGPADDIRPRYRTPPQRSLRLQRGFGFR